MFGDEFYIAPEARPVDQTIKASVETGSPGIGVCAAGAEQTPTLPISTDKTIESIKSVSSASAELLLLAAPPSCGKSTLARRLETGGYVRINQDSLGSLDKCMTAARQALQAGHSVCIDNTNMDINTRQKWIQLARQCCVKVV